MNHFACFLSFLLLVHVVLSTVEPPNLSLILFCDGDEDILPYWMEYHSALVGSHNILVIDQSQGKGEVDVILRTWGEKGVKIEKTSSIMKYKAKVAYALQLAEKTFPSNKVAFTVKPDEFLVSFGKDRRPQLGKTPFQESLIKFWQSPATCGHIEKIAFSCNKDPKEDTITTASAFQISKPSGDQRPTVYKYKAIPKVAELQCHEEVSFGLLKYLTRSPKLLLENALQDSIRAGVIKQDVKIENIKEHEMYLFNLATYESNPVRYKIAQLILYTMYGYEGISVPCASGAFELAKIDAVVQSALQ
jgi:hypothetical protein